MSTKSNPACFGVSASTASTSGNPNRRERRASEKQAALVEEQHERDVRHAQKVRAAEKRARAVRRCNQPEDDDEPMNSGSEGSDEDRQEPAYSFSSETVPTRHTQLVHRTSRVPRVIWSDNEDEVDDETHSASQHRGRTPVPTDPSVQSSSPVIGDKRPRSPSLVGNIRGDKVARIDGRSGRPRAKDLEPVEKDVLDEALHHFRSRIASVSAFPDHIELREFIQGSWDEACLTAGVSAVPLTPDIAKIMALRSAQTRGEMKTKARLLVTSHFGFRSGNSKKIIQQNRQLAADLKEANGFIYKKIYGGDGQLLPLGQRTGMYKNPVIGQLCNQMWFQNRRDEGVTYPEYYRPLSIPSMALLLTAIECAVDEWEQGIKNDIPFTTNEYKSIYDNHVTLLKEFDDKTKEFKILPNILRKLHDEGRSHAGAEPFTRGKPHISQSAIEAAIQEAQENSETEPDYSEVE